MARELATSGVVTKIHIVGFDLAGEAMAQLKCIAEPSGGLLVGARNAEELKSALTEVVTVSLPHNLVVKGLDANNKPLFVSVRILKAGQQVARSSGSTLRYSLKRYIQQLLSSKPEPTKRLRSIMVPIIVLHCCRASTMSKSPAIPLKQTSGCATSR